MHKNTQASIEWHHLRKRSDWEGAWEESYRKPVLIFKHSTRCGISHMALEKLESQWHEHPLSLRAYFLDLITYRDISNAIAKDVGVLHQSPQIILLDKGKCVFTTSHNAISVPVIAQALRQLSA